MEGYKNCARDGCPGLIADTWENRNFTLCCAACKAIERRRRNARRRIGRGEPPEIEEIARRELLSLAEVYEKMDAWRSTQVEYIKAKYSKAPD